MIDSPGQVNKFPMISGVGQGAAAGKTDRVGCKLLLAGESLKDINWLTGCTLRFKTCGVGVTETPVTAKTISPPEKGIIATEFTPRQISFPI
jgi:hypothetical protein